MKYTYLLSLLTLLYSLSSSLRAAIEDESDVNNSSQTSINVDLREEVRSNVLPQASTGSDLREGFILDYSTAVDYCAGFASRKIPKPEDFLKAVLLIPENVEDALQEIILTFAMHTSDAFVQALDEVLDREYNTSTKQIDFCEDRLPVGKRISLWTYRQGYKIDGILNRLEKNEDFITSQHLSNTFKNILSQTDLNELINYFVLFYHQRHLALGPKTEAYLASIFSEKTPTQGLHQPVISFLERYNMACEFKKKPAPKIEDFQPTVDIRHSYKKGILGACEVIDSIYYQKLKGLPAKKGLAAFMALCRDFKGPEKVYEQLESYAEKIPYIPYKYIISTASLARGFIEMPLKNWAALGGAPLSQEDRESIYPEVFKKLTHKSITLKLYLHTLKELSIYPTYFLNPETGKSLHYEILRKHYISHSNLAKETVLEPTYRDHLLVMTQIIKDIEEEEKSYNQSIEEQVKAFNKIAPLSKRAPLKKIKKENKNSRKKQALSSPGESSEKNQETNDSWLEASLENDPLKPAAQQSLKKPTKKKNKRAKKAETVRQQATLEVKKDLEHLLIATLETEASKKQEPVEETQLAVIPKAVISFPEENFELQGSQKDDVPSAPYETEVAQTLMTLKTEADVFSAIRSSFPDPQNNEQNLGNMGTIPAEITLSTSTSSLENIAPALHPISLYNQEKETQQAIEGEESEITDDLTHVVQDLMRVNNYLTHRLMNCESALGQWQQYAGFLEGESVRLGLENRNLKKYTKESDQIIVSLERQLDNLTHNKP